MLKLPRPPFGSVPVDKISSLFFLIASNSLSVSFWLEVLPFMRILFVVMEILSISNLVALAHLLKASRRSVSFAAMDFSPVALNWPLLTSSIRLNSLCSFLNGLVQNGFHDSLQKSSNSCDTFHSTLLLSACQDSFLNWYPKRFISLCQ